MMYKGGRFARGRVENERGGPRAKRDTHFARQKRERVRWQKEREKENDAREAYHGVIALSSINHVTYAPRAVLCIACNCIVRREWTPLLRKASFRSRFHSFSFIFTRPLSFVVVAPLTARSAGRRASVFSKETRWWWSAGKPVSPLIFRSTRRYCNNCISATRCYSGVAPSSPMRAILFTLNARISFSLLFSSSRRRASVFIS